LIYFHAIITHIYDNHIKFEVNLHFWQIWPTVRSVLCHVSRPLLQKCGAKISRPFHLWMLFFIQFTYSKDTFFYVLHNCKLQWTHFWPTFHELYCFNLIYVCTYFHIKRRFSFASLQKWICLHFQPWFFCNFVRWLISMDGVHSDPWFSKRTSNLSIDS
jgi:hypothetical protein